MKTNVLQSIRCSKLFYALFLSFLMMQVLFIKSIHTHSLPTKGHLSADRSGVASCGDQLFAYQSGHDSCYICSFTLSPGEEQTYAEPLQVRMPCTDLRFDFYQSYSSGCRELPSLRGPPSAFLG